MPERFQQGLSSASLIPLVLERGRSIVRIVVPDSSSGRNWVTLLAGPLRPGDPITLFAGEADITGAPGALEENMVQVFEENGKRSVVVGKRDREVQLCGRPSVLGPRVIDPSDLTLKPARVQRLSLQERTNARRIVAEVQEKSKPTLARLLHAVGASSAMGSPGALSDGDLETSWSEAKGGDGRGEFVVFRAPPSAPIQGIRLTIRPLTKDVPHGAAPRRLYLVDDQATFEVLLPENAWLYPGRSYLIPFSSPRSTTCVGLVLEDTYTQQGESAPAVTLTEVEALSRLDGKVSIGDLVMRLEQRGESAREAIALLIQGGIEARKAIVDRYENLSAEARFLALGAIDQGDCSESSPFFARLLNSKLKEEARHAKSRIERCGKSAAPALLSAIVDAAHPARLAAANELALLQPEEAISALLQLDWGRDRKAFLTILAKAARAPRAQNALREQLKNEALSPAKTLDLLRAAGDRLSDPEVSPIASQALTRVAQASFDFATRYLVLQPAAPLALVGDTNAITILRTATVDSSIPIRTAAIEAASKIVVLHPMVLAAARDPEPRVRQAAAIALQGQPGEAEKNALLSLIEDEWTFVKVAAYDSLAVVGADPVVDRHLLERLKSERVPAAQARAVEAIAKRRIAGGAAILLEIAKDQKATLEARSRATRALGTLCHRAALDWLTEVALAGSTPGGDGVTVELGGAALVALGKLHPANLADRLAPLLTQGAPHHAILAAQAALAETERCSSPLILVESTIVEATDSLSSSTPPHHSGCTTVGRDTACRVYTSHPCALPTWFTLFLWAPPCLRDMGSY